LVTIEKLKDQRAEEPKRRTAVFGSWNFGSLAFAWNGVRAMGASKSKTTATAGTGFALVRLLCRPQNRAAVLTAIVVLMAIAGAVYGWRRWGGPSIGSPEYVVTGERISVTPQPAWIHTKVKTEVVRSLTDARLELLDRELVENVAHAFALHPWVAKVVRVEKRFPAQVHVELEYRRPVLVVKLDAPGDEGLLFVDQQGVLLPSTDFAPTQAKDYLRIVAGGETPTSVYGTPWGTERISGAALVAAALGNRWQSAGLYSIAAVRGSGAELVYELRSQGDQGRVIWGSAPGHESTGEPTAAQKMAALDLYVREKGPLDKLSSVVVVDLRSLAAEPKKAATSRPRRMR
jgi:hypothetical protein